MPASQTCPRCSRLNPREAVFCWFDGHLLTAGQGNGASINFASRAFSAPFVFPSGASCRNFAELARACRDHPAAALDLLQRGFLENFLGSQGRVDLAHAAREAARARDRERGLDDFLGKLPGDTLRPPRLRVEPMELELGMLRVGEDRRLEVRLYNDGDRLLHGTANSDVGWLALGDSPGVAYKLFQLTRESVMVVHIRGRSLRAYHKQQTGTITFESNGGTVAVPFHVVVPITPFPDGVLAGAKNPRQMAEKAKAAPKEAAILIRNGAVARWYESNGWKYPVRGPTAAGLGAVQQLFEALGLVKAPKVEISTTALDLEGAPGERIEQVLAVVTEEKRAVVAYATCDESWLQVGRTIFNGRTATIPLIVPAVPDEPGTTLRCKVAVRANGDQRFVVPVSLAIRAAEPVYFSPETVPETCGPTEPDVMGAPTVLQGVEFVAAEPAYPEAAAEPVYLPPEPVYLPPEPVYAPPEPMEELASFPVAVPETPAYRRKRPRRWLYLLPPLAIGLGVLIVLLHYLVSGEDDRLLDSEPRLKVQLDKDAGKHFGLVLPEKDGKEAAQPRRITADPFGRTNNTCVLVDQSAATGGTLFGGSGGRWEEQEWVDTAMKIHFTQKVEVVQGVSSRLLDTCLVRYRIVNDDSAFHLVGLRVMLNTFLGSRGGGPFAVPGDPNLCGTDWASDGPAVPDFLQAMEKDDLKNPGSVVHLGLRLGDEVEPPSRMTLGAWPDRRLRDVADAPHALGERTLWDVPVRSMKLLDPPNAAVVLYWDEKRLEPKAVREVGFTYGLGTLAAGEGKGQLAVTAGGSFAPGGAFTVLAYVREPAAGQTVALELPEGLSLSAGSRERQEVEPVSAEVRFRPVAWRVKAANAEKHYVLKVVSSTGVSQSLTVFVKKRPRFD